MQKILLVAGARPNFVKIAPLWREFSKFQSVEVKIVHTGQHFDDAMSQFFFDDLQLPKPDYNLNIHGGSHAVQTGQIMECFDPVVEKEDPDDVIVTGDVNSTLACALVAVKRGIRTSHVEAGLRSFDRTMPEELNRIVTDSVSDLLFVSEDSGLKNLKREGVDQNKVFFVGNVMIDSLTFINSQIKSSTILKHLGIKALNYGLVTLHRPSNVDSPEQLSKIMEWLGDISNDIKLVFPVHPRTKKNLEELSSKRLIKSVNHSNLMIISPQRYIDFQKLLKSARFVITDSGGIQEETTWQGIPCITLRNNTERPVTIDIGTNYLTGDDLNLASTIIKNCIKGTTKQGNIPPLWDGKAASRIAKVIINHHTDRP
ncbi:non-hydrolyzing UDP-N-acetylglucosamine 2-epimerase [Thermophagus sp. OGC60D27]|uniref:non-hydrolyzing UDP-N-acetylglucosamine 2-epimerase n=1 Tax=Thermophagus sp. OGC60D27 TaxID=3458415 RepID=UPI0040376F1B